MFFFFEKKGKQESVDRAKSMGVRKCVHMRKCMHSIVLRETQTEIQPDHVDQCFDWRSEPERDTAVKQTD